MSATDMPHWKRNVGLFLTGQTISLLGSMLVQFAVMWHLTIETRSGSVLMLSIVFGMLPQAFVSIFGGVWADRHSRKLLIMGADTTIAVVTLGLALLMLSGVDDLWVIYVALAVRSVFAGIQTPAVSAMIPQIVPADQLMRVNGMFQSIQSGMMLLAPALAAAIYASFDIVAVFFVDAATALIGVGMLALVTVPRLVRADGADGPVSYFGDLAAGVRYIGANAPVKWLVALFALVMFLVGAPSYLTPLMVTRTFGDEVWKLTANELFWGGGMLLGGIIMATVGPRIKRRVRLMVGSVLLTGVLVAGLGLSTNMWVFFGLGLLIGIMFAALNTPAFTIIQERVEPEMQGRVFGFVGIVITVAMPLSMVVFGPLADQFSVESLLVLAGVLLVVVLGALLAVPAARRSLAEIDRAPEPAASETAASDEATGAPSSENREPAVPQDTADLH
ncbi:MFS transporter [Promicromonospora sukumoe]|uniref:DHA3 family macrolide efflux protein-like MFS transporter n=1 Tax=Promicromonospora sukumoe TaxID=88382 RepID=A0A7W3PCY0_9MICO|nr:MFS transporter [Promicromonospora sukumoe]MBA8807131.1 DHA3 family macrolide efflux protein-like MFS transporter [Promicromonospora sukumoe]